LTLCCTIFWQRYPNLKPFSMCLARLSIISFNSRFSAIRLSPDNCFIFTYKQTVANPCQTLFSRVNRSVPYNTSTCIDAKTIPLVSKYLIKSNNKGSKVRGSKVQRFGVQRFKGSGFKGCALWVACYAFRISRFDSPLSSRQRPANTGSNL
jgi:hypothetical protein